MNNISAETTPTTTMILETTFLSFAHKALTGMVVTVLGWVSGEAFSVVLEVPPEPHWYLHPAVVSAFVTASLLIVMELVKGAIDQRKQARKNEKADDDRRVSTSEKIHELTQQERRELLGGLNSLHEKETGFLKHQIFLGKVEEFELRERAHAFANEVNRLHLHIHQCHLDMAAAGVTAREFQTRHYNQIVEGIDQKVAVFRAQMLERKEDV